MESTKENKIFIIPYYIYTHIKVIDYLGKTLSNQFRLKLLYIPGNRFFNQINEKYLSKLSLKINRQFLIPSFESKNALVSIIKLPILVVNFGFIFFKLLFDRPDTVILTTDLGGLYIRYIQEICIKKQIKIIVVQNTLFLNTNHREDIAPKFNTLFLKIMRFLKVERLFSFAGDIPGFYKKESYVLCNSKDTYNLIQNNGKDSDKIFLFNLPEHEEDRKTIFAANDKKNVLYVTEVIQEIKGEEYLTEINVFLSKVFSQIDDKYNVIIKLHPRESKKSITYCKEYFHKYSIIEDEFNIDEILKTTDLVIGCYSAVLETAKAKGVSVLSLEKLNGMDIKVSSVMNTFIEEIDGLMKSDHPHIGSATKKEAIGEDISAIIKNIIG